MKVKWLLGGCALVLPFCVLGTLIMALGVMRSPASHCTATNVIYQHIQADHQQWLFHFQSAPREILSFSEPYYHEVRYHHPSVVNNRFVVVETMTYPHHPLGSKGYIYAEAGLIPRIAPPYEIKPVEGNIYCYWR